MLVFPVHSVNKEFWPDLRDMLEAVFPIPLDVRNFVVPDGTRPATEDRTTGSTLIVASLSPRSWRTKDSLTQPPSSSHRFWLRRP